MSRDWRVTDVKIPQALQIAQRRWYLKYNRKPIKGLRKRVQNTSTFLKDCSGTWVETGWGGQNACRTGARRSLRAVWAQVTVAQTAVVAVNRERFGQKGCLFANRTRRFGFPVE